MKIVKLTILLIVIISSSAFSQSITLFNVDASEFPLMRAKFYAFDEAGNQQRPGINQLSITENGIERTITNVSCPPPQPPQRLSVVLLVDVTIYNNIYNAKSVLTSWVDQLELGKNEVALVSYEGNSYINQDFTTDRNLLQSAINNLRTLGSKEDHPGAMIRPVTGGISVAEKGKFRKVILLLSSCSHFSSDKIPTIIQRAKQNNVMLNFAIFDRYDWTPESTMQMSLETGGYSVNKIPYNDLETAKNAFMIIYHHAQGGVPCTIEWESGPICRTGTTNVELHWNSAIGKSTYTPLLSAVAKLEYEPTILRFLDPEPGVWHSANVRVTARNGQFIVTDVEVSNDSYVISPRSFTLEPDESIVLTASYFPMDSGYTNCRFNLINETCPSVLYARSGMQGMQATERTIKLLHPNGGEVFVAGSDTAITWEGVSEYEPVRIEYRTSDEEPWITITESASGLNHPFSVPNIVSDKYLARVTARSHFDFCEVEIGEQIWMCYNLDIEYYRNGDAIFHAQTDADWKEAGEQGIGAWCYYDNDPDNGEVYGKLYNWYAVNDPRGLAPDGWRVPSDEDWKELEIELGMAQSEADRWERLGGTEGSRLAGRPDLWDFGKLRGFHDFNSSGFTGLPGGYRLITGMFISIGQAATWWTSSEYISYGHQYYISRYISAFKSSIERRLDMRESGYSVRCIKE